MNWDYVQQELLNSRYRETANAAVLNRRPWIFSDDASYTTWKEMIDAVLGTDKVEFRLVGSAATGFSLSPFHPGRPFKKIGLQEAPSDIDVAILNEDLFVQSWNAVIDEDRIASFGGGEKANRMRMGIYNGFLTTKRIPRRAPAALKITKIKTALNRPPPLRGYEINCRVYRRLDDLEAYHSNSLRQLHEMIVRGPRNGK